MSKIQVGIIAYRDKHTNKFKNSQPLLLDETQELLHEKQELIKEITILLLNNINEILNKTKNKENLNQWKKLL